MFQIAFSGALSPANILFLKHLAEKGNRLLIANSKNFSEDIITKFQQQTPDVEIEITTCLRDSCWEADIIILSSEIADDNQVLKNISEVATQKLVLCISEGNNYEDFNKLEQFLSHSKLALVRLNSQKREARILMTSEEAGPGQFFEGINYTLVPEKQKNRKHFSLTQK